MDGRSYTGVISTAGGDAAEFILALRTAGQYGLPLDEYVVESVFRKYVAKLPPLRKMYMHTGM